MCYGRKVKIIILREGMIATILSYDATMKPGNTTTGAGARQGKKVVTRAVITILAKGTTMLIGIDWYADFVT